MTCGMLRSSTSSGALTSVRPALRSFLALRMRSAGKYVSGTRVMRRTYSTAAQLRAKKADQREASRVSAPRRAHACLLRTHMMSVYHVHLQLVFWLMKPEMSGPETGPTAPKKSVAVVSKLFLRMRIFLLHEGESDTYGKGPQCTLPLVRRLRAVERCRRSCRPRR